MWYTNEQLTRIYNRTSGYCHICHKKLAFKNYSESGTRGAWEVDHSNPQVRRGTDRLNNLYPACIDCNRSKGARSTRTARIWYSKTRAPLSVGKRREVKTRNAILGGLAGGLLGAVAGPWGAATGAALGARFGYKRNPDK